MKKKTPVIWLIAGLVTALAIIISGCSTKNPWTPNPKYPLTLSIVTGPADSAVVPFGSAITYSWTTKGGTGEVNYQYQLDANGFSPLSRANSVTFTGLDTNSTHTVTINAVDATGASQTAARNFSIGPMSPPPAADTIPPTVFLSQAPSESSYVAAGPSSVLAFTWDGFDSLGSGSDLMFRYAFNGDTSVWAVERSVNFTGLTPVMPAVFSVWSMDTSGNISPVPATVIFFIRNANVLYIDDYQWLDSYGNVDQAKEREQKNFYRDVLRGYAFAEWDNDARGAIPTMADLAGFTTIVWAADADNSCNPEPNYRLYFDVGAVGGGVLKDFIDAGGHLLLTGPQTLNYIYNTIPPAPTDFEAAYLGVATTTKTDTLWWKNVVVSEDTVAFYYDTLVVDADSMSIMESDPWQVTTNFTWAIKEPNVTGYPDSMKIDVAKNGAQVGCAATLNIIENGRTPIFKVGLNVDNLQPDPPNYARPCGWIYAPAGTPISATLEFDTFSEGEPAMQQTFHTILQQFGEGHGL